MFSNRIYAIIVIINMEEPKNPGIVAMTNSMPMDYVKIAILTNIIRFY